MSKLGRYSAQRRKVAFISAAKTVEVSECGTTFELSASHAANYSVTLPSLDDAGSGWWAKFVMISTESKNVDLVAQSGDLLLTLAPVAGVGDADGLAGADGPWETASFVGGAAAMGDMIEFQAHPNSSYLDDESGAQSDIWLGYGVMSGSGGITGSSAD